ncbi:MAG: hypothetical protein PVSMB8_00810 [Vulcanimicrobiaceae bacterium]
MTEERDLDMTPPRDIHCGKSPRCVPPFDCQCHCDGCLLARTRDKIPADVLGTPPAAKSFRKATDLLTSDGSVKWTPPEEKPLVGVKRRPSFADIYMAFALKLSERSTCSRLQVGCAIVSADSRYVYGIGYNGGAAGLENECASLEPGNCLHLHGEENAIINCTAPRSASKVVFVSHLPCVMCAKRLINLGGVARVHYAHDYRIRDSVDLFARAGIECTEYAASSPT